MVEKDSGPGGSEEASGSTGPGRPRVTTEAEARRRAGMLVGLLLVAGGVAHLGRELGVPDTSGRAVVLAAGAMLLGGATAELSRRGHPKIGFAVLITGMVAGILVQALG